MSNEAFSGRIVWDAFMNTAGEVTSYFNDTPGAPANKPGVISRLFGLNK